MDVAQDLTGLLDPIGNSVGKRMYRAVAAEWQRNRSTVLRAAEAAEGLTREQFEAWAEEEPRAIPLYVKILWAAGMNGHMPDDVAALTGTPSEVVQQCLINLAGAGLVGTQSVFGGTAYPVTGLGRAVVHASEAAREWRSHA